MRAALLAGIPSNPMNTGRGDLRKQPMRPGRQYSKTNPMKERDAVGVEKAGEPAGVWRLVVRFDLHPVDAAGEPRAEGFAVNQVPGAVVDFLE